MTSPWTGWLLGFALGLRHALEPDHLAAVSTVVGETKRPGAAAIVGAAWGVGHTLSLLALGGALLLLELKLPPRAGDALEGAVAVMLVALGVRSLRRAFVAMREGPTHVHAHGGERHVHAGPAEHVHVGRVSAAVRPLLIGVAHGLAGSGALVALALASTGSVAGGLVYMLLFGAGSVVAMALLTGVLGHAAVRWLRAPRAASFALVATGMLSIGVGVAWGVPIAARLLAS